MWLAVGRALSLRSVCHAPLLVRPIRLFSTAISHLARPKESAAESLQNALKYTEDTEKHTTITNLLLSRNPQSIAVAIQKLHAIVGVFKREDFWIGVFASLHRHGDIALLMHFYRSLKQILGVQSEKQLHCPMIFKHVLACLHEHQEPILQSRVAVDFLKSHITGGDYILYELVLQGLQTNPLGYQAHDVIRLFNAMHDAHARRIERIPPRIYFTICQMLTDLGASTLLEIVCNETMKSHPDALTPALILKILAHLTKFPRYIHTAAALYLLARDPDRSLKTTFPPQVYTDILNCYIKSFRHSRRSHEPDDPQLKVALQVLLQDVASLSTNPVIANLLILCYCRLGERSKAEELFYRYRKDPGSNVLLESHFIEGACFLRDVGLLKQLRQEIFSLPASQLPLQTLQVFHNSFLYQAATLKEIVLMEEWFQEGVSRGIFPNLLTYHALLSGFYYASDHAKFVTTFFNCMELNPSQHKGIVYKAISMGVQHKDFSFLFRIFPSLSIGDMHVVQVAHALSDVSLGEEHLEARVQLLELLSSKRYRDSLHDPKVLPPILSFCSRFNLWELRQRLLASTPTFLSSNRKSPQPATPPQQATS